jgi:hypothetical protein
MARVDPDRGIGAGRLTEAAYRRRFAAGLGLPSAQADEFIADMWRWYCGEPDQELTAYAGLLHRSTPEHAGIHRRDQLAHRWLTGLRRCRELAQLRAACQARALGPRPAPPANA